MKKSKNIDKNPIVIHGQYHSVMRARAFDLYRKNPKAALEKYPEFNTEFRHKFSKDKNSNMIHVKKISWDEYWKLFDSGGLYLYNDYEDMVFRYDNKVGKWFAKIRGKPEFETFSTVSKVLADAILDKLLITKADYDNFG
jgi:hypothetical protein